MSLRVTSFAPLALLIVAACSAVNSEEENPAIPTPDRCIGCGDHNWPAPPPPPVPSFGATVSLDPAPPPLGGASVLVTEDGATAVVTDPDRDRVVIVDLATKKVASVALEPGAEPGRLIDDAAKRVHVVLDRKGDVVTIDLATATAIARRPTCAAPQGITRSETTLYVACTGGEIVTLPVDPAGGEPKVLARLDRDLRDVVAIGDDLYVSRLRKAEVLQLKRSDGSVIARTTAGFADSAFAGWRLIADGTEGVALVHQIGKNEEIQVVRPSAYSSPSHCNGTIESTVTTFRKASTPSSSDVPQFGEMRTRGFLAEAVLPIDVARSRSGAFWAVIAAGNGHIKELPQIHAFAMNDPAPCIEQPSSKVKTVGRGQVERTPTTDPPGQTVAAAFTRDDKLVVFTREPAAIHLRAAADVHDQSKSWESISLGGPSREDTGHAIFHSNSGGGIACASCHPAGGDDGRVWKFSTGARRTQSLRGTLKGTAPYHWSGNAPGIETFASEVFTAKMAGPTLDEGQVGTLRSWLENLATPPAESPSDAAAAARGKTLFESAAVGCSVCHAGAKLTNNLGFDVGTGGVFQVPSLVGVGARSPWFHDGRAIVIYDTVTRSNNRHGTTATLTSAQLKDLAAYVETL